MTKSTLQEYIDAKELIKETERDIQNLRRTETVYDKVSGSNPEFPYQPQSFNVSGVYEIRLDNKKIKKEEMLLLERKEKARKIKLQIDDWMNTIPLRMQRIIRYKFFEGMSWEEAAVKMGRKATGDSIRKELNRFIEEN